MPASYSGEYPDLNDILPRGGPRPTEELGVHLVIPPDQFFYYPHYHGIRAVHINGRGIMNAAIVIPICCVCNRVREHVQTVSHEEPWDTLDAFLRAHHLSSGEYHLTHTYCPACARQFRKLHRIDDRTSRQDNTSGRSVNDTSRTILDVFSSVQKCDLDMLVQACPTLTWNQVFSEVDRLSRSGQLRLNYLGQGQYSIELPETSDMRLVSQS